MASGQEAGRQSSQANAPIAVRNSKKAVNDGLQTDMDRAIVIEENLFGACFETEDQREGMTGIP